MPLPGSQVDEYSIIHRVAVGATSEIYEGRHRDSGEPVAVKVLRPEWCLHAEVVARFLNEAQTLQRLRHPHLVKAMASGTLPQGAPFMVLEWLPVDLHQLLAEAGGRLPLATSVQIIQQLAGALEMLHTHDLIHRDLKPANVLLARREARALLVKLADLGLAKHSTGGSSLPSAVHVSTAGSALLGTWDYMAPEQWIQSKSVDPKTDIYALGVLWFQMLAGRLPFIAGAEKDLMYHHLLEPPPLELLGGQVPEPTRSLVARMLSKKASERPTPREIQELLSTAAGWCGPGWVRRRSEKKHRARDGSSRLLASFEVGTGKGAVMWSVREALEKFIQRLELKPEEQEAVIHQHTVVREALRKRLGPKTDFLSGSYSRNTAIRPLHDIDLFIVLESAASPPSTSPDAVLKQVRQALHDEWSNKELPILQRHSVHLEFSGSGIEFDVVPAVEQSGQQAYFIPERQTRPEQQTSQWIRTNPQLHKERSTEANERAGKKLKPLLKAVKHWNRRQSSSPLGSFHLEVMSYSAFPHPPAGYLEGLEALFSHLSRQVMLSCPDPAGLGPNVDKQMIPTQREAARQLLESAAKTMRLVLAEEKTSPAQAHARLRELFGEEYRDRDP